MAPVFMPASIPSSGERSKDRKFSLRTPAVFRETPFMRFHLTALLPTLAGLFAGLTAAGGEFPAPFNTEKDAAARPMPAAEAAAKFGLPPGFRATVFAAEPDVQNPIALAWDARGRLWIAENYTYAESGVRYELKLRDRILIFEDRDGDGHFDDRR